MTKNSIIITGHGSYASGIQSSIKLILGDNSDLYFIDFLKEDSSEDLLKKFKNTIKDNDINNLVFVCDLLGGTPFNTAVNLSLENKNFKVTSGCNLNSILEGILQKDTCTADELADMLVDKTKSTTLKFTIDTNNSTIDENDGI